MNTAKLKIVYVCYDQEKLNKARRILEANKISYRFQTFNNNAELMLPFESENIYYEISVEEKDYLRAQYLLKNL